jgi:hypothetical protein
MNDLDEGPISIYHVNVIEVGTGDYDWWYFITDVFHGARIWMGTARPSLIVGDQVKITITKEPKPDAPDKAD